MAIWGPDDQQELRYLAPQSVAAAPVGDGSWIVATNKRVLRQFVGEKDGIHLRNQLAIPVATTSKQWPHLLLEPKGNRLHVHAVNLDDYQPLRGSQFILYVCLGDIELQDKKE